MKTLERKVWLAYFTVAVSLALSIYAVFIGQATQPVAAQSDMFLSRRIDQVEQRFYSLESRLNRLETSARPSALPSVTSGSNDIELQFLRTQIDALRVRVGEVECGVLKLDERTLSPSARAGRKAKNSEPCRQDVAAPVSLSARP